MQRSAATVLAHPVGKMDLEDRDAYLDGDDAVLNRYGFEPSPSDISAIVISVHPEHRDDWDELRDLDDEELERVEWRREMEDRRRESEERERRQRDALEQAQRELTAGLPPVPGNAYSPDSDGR